MWTSDKRTKMFVFLITAFLIFPAVAETFQSQASFACLQHDPKSFSVSLEQNSNQNFKELIDKVWQVVNRSYINTNFNGQSWQAIRSRYLAGSYTSKADTYRAIKGMLQLLGDRYTRFFTPEEFKSLTQPSLGNIDLGLLRDRLTNQLLVRLGDVESPASKAGLLPGDVVLSINGYRTQDMDGDQASNLLSGVAGTSVVLRVRRGSKDLEFTVRRSTQKSLPLYAISQTTQWGKVGYIRFMKFTSNAESLMRTEILNFEKEQVSGYILDLRANPGGLLYASIDIVRMWLQEGTILSTISRQDKDREHANQTALTNKPLVILVDGQSSSASEITASALQENQRAILVGTPTYGLSSIQSFHQLADGSGLAVTVAKWLTSKGRDIENTGVVPNVVVNLTQTEQQDLIRQRNLATLADPQYAKALQILYQQINKQ